MRKQSILTLFAVIILLPVFVFAQNTDTKAEVEEVIKRSYFNGAFNDQDTEAMREGFHKEFSIFSADGEEISRYQIDTWIKGIEKRKESENYDPERVKMDCRIVSTDVTGNCAAVKVEMFKDSKPVYTDYISLLKFSSGWKIVAKVYHAH